MLNLKTFNILLFALPVFLFGCKPDHKTSILAEKHSTAFEKVGKNNYAYRWAEVALAATGKDTDRFRPRPTITSRYLGLVFVTIFDAWSRYDSTATTVYLDGVERRPEQEQTEKNKEIAISYAAYGALSEYYYSDSLMLREFMTDLGLDPDNTSLDPSTPEGIGNLAAKAVIRARKNDGSNQYGDEKGSDGTFYCDYTKYQPVNNPDKNTDINRWQPKYFADGKGGKVCPPCLTPFWHKVKPVALKSADQFRSPPPPEVGSAQMEAEVKQVVDMQANITNDQKALVEFMRDGPSSVQQAGHWLKFAQNVSLRDSHNLDQDVKMYFLTEVTAMDAFIACWDTKMKYDNARPYALVHYYFKDKTIKGWGGPDKGIISMKGQDWRPYSPETFVCPPFPAYVSGHSTVSGGCSEVLRLFTGSDHFGEEIKRVPGVLTGEMHLGDTVTIKMPTFTETAEIAGISRVLGGYHIQADNLEGLKLGRKVGHAVWAWYQEHVRG
ncbi:MAG TPA: vanadium-dependent haloperoxidase [Saprospiraceae bacterium]|nr:vanadium-dependent haloperoxidase [Saprospiraceae bacterium]